MARYQKNIYCEEIVQEEYTILIIHDSKRYFKLRTSIWNNIQYYVENGQSVDLRLKKIFENLLYEGVIFDMNNTHFVYESIMVQLTDKCNLGCKHCCAKMLTSKGDVSMEVIKKIISMNPKSIVLTGGEPMLNSNFIDIIRYIRKKYGGKIVLMTNGTLINDKNLNELCEMIDSFEISIDGTNKYDTEIVRGKGVYEKVENVINMLVLRNQRVTVSAVKECCSSENAFTEWAKKIGVKSALRMLNVVDEVEKNFDLLIKGGKEHYIEETCKELCNSVGRDDEIYNCGMSRYEIFVGVDGSIYPCGGLASDEFIVGDIHNLDGIKQRPEIVERLLEKSTFYKCRKCIYRSGCWDCLSELINYSHIPQIFDEYCRVSKLKWKNILHKETF